jgi:hypothetical protein
VKRKTETNSGLLLRGFWGVANYLIVRLLRARGKNVEMQTLPFMNGLTLNSTKYCVSTHSNLKYVGSVKAV